MQSEIASDRTVDLKFYNKPDFSVIANNLMMKALKALFLHEKDNYDRYIRDI